MLQAHSLLWNYLWIAPNLILFILGILLLIRGTARQLPAFTTYGILSSLGGLVLFVADVLSSVSGPTFWRIDWATLSLESVLKFVAIGEVFARVFNPYPAVSKLGKYLVSAVGALLVFVAAFIAAISPGDSTLRVISGAHLLDFTVFLIECGLILSIFLLAAYFRMPWDRHAFGILLGFGTSSCVHLAAWTTMTLATPSAHERMLFDFLNMATYHVSVLIWFYFLVGPSRNIKKGPADDSGFGRTFHDGDGGSSQDLEEQLKDWNRELERLFRQ